MASSFNATRLTCFALISALETDCRDMILTLESDNTLAWPLQATDLARERLLRERGTAEAPTHTSLVNYLDFADSYQILLANKEVLPPSTVGALREVQRFLEPMIAVRNRVAHSRPMEFDDLATSLDVARALVKTDRDNWETTDETLVRLQKNPEFVLGLTIQLPSDPDERAHNNLPVPDFDETGFMGRANEIKRIKKALLGPYPVVSILGDGGIGKTSIALKVAYELLDDDNAKFDAIVWVTAKSTTLTSGEIQNISGAIQDSLGLFEEAARTLGGVGGEDPVAELLEYLSSFKILLVLDNMETVTDQGLRDFLLDLPIGSKVLITSRIGLGIENPVKLEPLAPNESKGLLKALASIRNIRVLRELDEPGLDKLVTKLQGHPLFIKWLVAGVQAGKRPSELVNDNSLLLDFCMSNVYEQLGKSARGVLQSMQVLPGVRSQGELAYLNEVKAIPIQSALLELMTTNFVALCRSGDDALEAGYETGDFAVQYLSRHHPVEPKFRAEITARSQELSDIAARLRSGGGSKYDSRIIDIRGRSDVPSARLLLDAQKMLKSGNVEGALEMCREAQNLSPNYQEAWRVEALAHDRRRDQGAALHAYERAFELSMKSVLMSYHFGNFLVDSLQDTERGLSVLQGAAKADGDNIQVLSSIARIQFMRADYAATAEICLSLVSKRLSTAMMKSTVKIGLRASLYGAEYWRWEGDLARSLELIDVATQIVKNAPVADIEIDAADWLVRLRTIAEELAVDFASEEYLSRRCGDIANQLLDRVRVIDASALTRSSGQVRKVEFDKHYAFAETGGRDFFFHHNDLVDRAEWDLVIENVLVCFDPDRNSKGQPRAKRVRVL